MKQTSKGLFMAAQIAFGLMSTDDLTIENWDLLGYDYYKCRERGFPSDAEVKQQAVNIILYAIRDGVEK